MRPSLLLVVEFRLGEKCGCLPQDFIRLLKLLVLPLQQLQTLTFSFPSLNFRNQFPLSMTNPLTQSLSCTTQFLGNPDHCSPLRLILSPLLREQSYRDRKSTRLNSSHVAISYAVFCLKKKKEPNPE